MIIRLVISQTTDKLVHEQGASLRHYATIIEEQVLFEKPVPIPDVETTFSIMSFDTPPLEVKATINRLIATACAMARNKDIRRIEWTDTKEVWDIAP